LAKTKPF